MRFGVIEITADGEIREQTGVASRRGVVLDAVEPGSRSASSEFEVIYLVAATGRTIVHDVVLPAPLSGRMLEEALEYELDTLLPVPKEMVYWGYRRLSRDNRSFRIFAVHREEAAGLLTVLAGSGLRCDCFLPSQLLLNTRDDADPPSGIELMLDYLPTDPGGKNLRPVQELIPKELRPVRHRRWRLFYQLMLGVAAVMALLVFAARYQEFAAECQAFSDRRVALEEELRKVQAFSARLARERELMQKINDAKFGSSPALPVLADLNSRLPEYMHLESYNQKAEQIEVTIVSTHDDPNLARILLGSPLYTSDLRKTVQPESQETTFNVTLRSLRP